MLRLCIFDTYMIYLCPKCQSLNLHLHVLLNYGQALKDAFIIGFFLLYLCCKLDENLDYLLQESQFARYVWNFLFHEFDFVLARQRNARLIIGEFILHMPFKEKRLFFVVCEGLRFLVGSLVEEEQQSVQRCRQGSQLTTYLVENPFSSVVFLWAWFFSVCPRLLRFFLMKVAVFIWKKKYC